MSMDLSLKGWGGSFFEENATEESSYSSSDEDVVSGGGKPVPPAQPNRIAQTGRKTHQPNETPAEAKSVERANRQSDADDRYHAKHTPPAPVPPHKTHRI